MSVLIVSTRSVAEGQLSPRRAWRRAVRTGGATAGETAVRWRYPSSYRSMDDPTPVAYPVAVPRYLVDQLDDHGRPPTGGATNEPV
jgi:hypothetical protein